MVWGEMSRLAYAVSPEVWSLALSAASSFGRRRDLETLQGPECSSRVSSGGSRFYLEVVRMAIHMTPLGPLTGFSEVYDKGENFLVAGKAESYLPPCPCLRSPSPPSHRLFLVHLPYNIWGIVSTQ